MIIVVDAYNLLHSISTYKKTITDQERAKFINQLGVYGRRKGHKIVIVFDGGPYEWPYRERTKIVQVVYSGINESADDYIKEYIDGHKAQDLLLVSSDSELNFYAQQANIPSIDSATFFELLRMELSRKQLNSSHQKNNQNVTIMHESNESIDALMMEASKKIPLKSEDFVSDKKLMDKTARPKKHERELLKKLKKL
jgi:predicted RNA-binding protein with PIN domain